MNESLITSLLGIIIASIISQTVAVWIRFAALEKKIIESKCPFGGCPLWLRAKDEAAIERKMPES